MTLIGRKSMSASRSSDFQGISRGPSNAGKQRFLTFEFHVVMLRRLNASPV